MGALIEIGIPNKKGEYQNWTVQISDTVSMYGTNVRMYPKQTKEEIAQNKKPEKVFYGKVFWTNGKIEVARKPEEKPSDDDKPFEEEEYSDLPFEEEEDDDLLF